MNFLTRIAFLTTKQVGILALILGFLYYKTAFDDGSDLQGNIAQAQAELEEEKIKKANTEKTLETRDRLQEILTKLTDQYEQLSRKIPTDLNDFEVNQQINSLVQAARIRPISRKPLDPVSGKVLVELPYELKLMGGYSELAQFVYMVSTAERVMVIKKIALTPAEPYDGKLTFDVVLSAYKLAGRAPVEDKQ